MCGISLGDRWSWHSDHFSFHRFLLLLWTVWPVSMVIQSLPLSLTVPSNSSALLHLCVCVCACVCVRACDSLSSHLLRWAGCFAIKADHSGTDGWMDSTTNLFSPYILKEVCGEMRRGCHEGSYQVVGRGAMATLIQLLKCCPTTPHSGFKLV